MHCEDGMSYDKKKALSFYSLVVPGVLHLLGTSPLKKRSALAAAPWKSLLESVWVCIPLRPGGPALQNCLMQRLSYSETYGCLWKETNSF